MRAQADLIKRSLVNSKMQDYLDFDILTTASIQHTQAAHMPPNHRPRWYIFGPRRTHNNPQARVILLRQPVGLPSSRRM